MQTKFVLILFFILSSLKGWSQDREAIIQQRIEFISEQLETEDLDLTNIYEVLVYYYEHPINLNNTSTEELEELGLLSDIQINDLLTHIKVFGKLISIYELQSLRFWDLSSIELVLPFVRVDDKLDQVHVSLKEAIQQGKFEAYLRYQSSIESKAGYEDVPDSIKLQSNKYYWGDKNRYYSRLRFSYRTNLSVGITAEKDPGEAFFANNNKSGFDFYSAHVFYKGGKYLRAFALGDYQVQIGQGLNLWSGYAFGKTADVANVKKSAQPIKPYTSVDETRFLRGAAVDLGFKNFEWTNFASVKGVDASIQLDTLLEDLQFVSSINLTGFHRTNSEIERKDALQERIIGSNLRYNKNQFHIGVAGIYWGYDKAYNKAVQNYNQFDFRGKQNVSVSADYSWVLRNFLFFGEVSRVSYSGDFAQLHGLIVALDARASLSVVYRNYGKAYETFYNGGFAEGSQTKNEEGIYTGLSFKLNRNWMLNTYVDFFKFPWLKYQVDAPSKGNELMAQLSYKPTKTLEIYGRFRQQTKPKNSRISDGTITEIEDLIQRNYRINLSYKVSDDFTFKSRVEYVTLARANRTEDGVIVTQDLLYNPKSMPIDISLRYALFQTDSYDTRIYTYENNALYVFSTPSYYYQGSRAYILVRYSFLKHFDLWARFGTYIYANRKSVGSGAEEIKGTTKTDLTIQLRLKL